MFLSRPVTTHASAGGRLAGFHHRDLEKIVRGSLNVEQEGAVDG